MKWINLGVKNLEQAKECKAWFENHNIRTGEIFDCYGIWQVPYMPIGKEQKKVCDNIINSWINDCRL